MFLHFLDLKTWYENQIFKSDFSHEKPHTYQCYCTSRIEIDFLPFHQFVLGFGDQLFKVICKFTASAAWGASPFVPFRIGQSVRIIKSSAFCAVESLKLVEDERCLLVSRYLNEHHDV